MAKAVHVPRNAWLRIGGKSRTMLTKLGSVPAATGDDAGRAASVAVISMVGAMAQRAGRERLAVVERGDAGGGWNS